MTAQTRKKLLTRANRIAGQVAGVQRMLQEDRYCVDVLHQIAAVRSALDSLGVELLTRHLESCVESKRRDRRSKSGRHPASRRPGFTGDGFLWRPLSRRPAHQRRIRDQSTRHAGGDPTRVVRQRAGELLYRKTSPTELPRSPHLHCNSYTRGASRPAVCTCYTARNAR